VSASAPLLVLFRGTLVPLNPDRMAEGIATGHPLEWARLVLEPEAFAAHIGGDPHVAAELAEAAIRVFDVAAHAIAPVAGRQP
jgi:mannose/cellobiose epimerase-like protein (N-acyl-D-glucosamine 2-epimerase family)